MPLAKKRAMASQNGGHSLALRAEASV